MRIFWPALRHVFKNSVRYIIVFFLLSALIIFSLTKSLADRVSRVIVMIDTSFYTSVALLAKRRENYPSPSPRKKRELVC